MAAMKRWAAAIVLSFSACASDTTPRTDQQQREQVGQNLTFLGQGLRAGTWSRVERFFSPAYYEGYGELRDRIEDQMRRQTLLDLQFDVTRVLEADGLVNAQVRWRKSWIDNATGATRKAEGMSEFILKPERGGYRILRISGDRLF